MPLTKLTSTDAFVVTDIAGDVPAGGIVRAARKVLQGGAKDLARSATYTFASFEHQRSGASAGINAEGDTVGEAVTAFAEELSPRAESGQLNLDAGKGVDASAIAGLTSSVANREVDPVAATVAGVVASAQVVTQGVEGRRVVIEGQGPVPTALAVELRRLGAELVEVDGAATKPWLTWAADADVVLAGSKAGALTHQGVPSFKASALVPWGPIPVTTKAFADLRARGVVVLPDFITAAGGLLGRYLDGDQEAVDAAVVSHVSDALHEVLAHDDGPLLAACYRAEAYLESWTDRSALFGRPLAS